MVYRMERRAMERRIARFVAEIRRVERETLDRLAADALTAAPTEQIAGRVGPPLRDDRPATPRAAVDSPADRRPAVIPPLRVVDGQACPRCGRRLELTHDGHAWVCVYCRFMRPLPRSRPASIPQNNLRVGVSPVGGELDRPRPGVIAQAIDSASDSPQSPSHSAPGPAGGTGGPPAEPGGAPRGEARRDEHAAGALGAVVAAGLIPGVGQGR